MGKGYTFRLIDTLTQVDLIAASARMAIITRGLELKHLISLKNCSKQAHRPAKHNCMMHLALVSDAGTPNICDPGAYFISQLRNNDIPIVLFWPVCNYNRIIGIWILSTLSILMAFF